MHAHSETLRVLHTIYRNTLDLLLTVPDAIPGITSKLYPHQETLIQGMHDYRARMTHGIQLDDHELKARIGIIADPSGTGKTLSVLGYLASDTNQYPTTELSPYSTPIFIHRRLLIRKHLPISSWSPRIYSVIGKMKSRSIPISPIFPLIHVAKSRTICLNI